MNLITHKKILSKDWWEFTSLLLIAVSFPLPLKVSNLFIGLAVLVWLVSGNVTKKAWQAFQNPIFWTIAAFFLLHVAAIAYSENAKAAIFVVEKKLPLFVLPLIIFSTNLSKSQRDILLYSFAWSIAITSFILTSKVIYEYILQGSCISCIHHEFTSLIGLHAIYFSYYCLFSILILLSTIFNREKGKRKTSTFYLETAAITFLIIALFFAASKTVLISLVILLPVFGVIATPIQKKKLLTLFLLFIFSCLTIAYSFQPVQDRFSKIFNDKGFKSLAIVGTSQKLDNNQKRELTGLSLRVLLGKIGLYQVHKDKKYFFGYAPADVREKLNNVYLSHNMAPNWFFNYNVHNQYIHTFMGLGIVGLFSLFSMLASGYFSSFKKNDPLFFFFILIVSIAFLTEVVLALNKGIVFFSYFYALFLSKKYST